MESLPSLDGFRRWFLGLDIYHGWFVVFATFLVSFMPSGTLYTFGVFFTHIVESFGHSHANTSINILTSGDRHLRRNGLLGAIIDQYSVRRLTVLGAVLLVGGLVGASQFTSFVGVAVSYGLVTGSGIGILYFISYKTPVRWFDCRQGLALGISTSGSGSGLLVLPPLAVELIDLFGWRQAYRRSCCWLIAIAALFLKESPAAMGVDAGGETENDDGNADA